MIKTSTVFCAAVGVATSCLASCGGAHDAMRGDQPKAADVMGEASVQPVEGPSSPLVVDWKSEQRADLEEIVSDGDVVVVAWDAKGFRLLRKCKLHGDYGYLALGLKKDVVRFESADEVTANLPLGGLGIVGKIGGDFSKGETLDIAMAMVGKRRTVLSDVKKSDLQGECDDATHYVRAMSVGAFAMKTGTKAQASGAVEIFGAGTSGSSGSSKDVSNSDGALDACEKATGEEQKPLGKCSAVLRLELEPLLAGGASSKEKDHTKEKTKPESPSATLPDCPPGLVWASSACVKPERKLPHACKEMDGPDCKAQCAAGSAESCWQYGWYVYKAEKNLEGSIGPYNQSCDAGFAIGCFELGEREEERSDPIHAMNAFSAACKLGDAKGCRYVADYFRKGLNGMPKSAAEAAHQYVRGCNGGDGWSCSEVGAMLANGEGDLKPDLEAALFFSKRGCSAGDKLGCDNAQMLMKSSKYGGSGAKLPPPPPPPPPKPGKSFK